MESALCIPDDPGFRLIETALWTPEGGVQNRVRHLARLRRTAEALNIQPFGLDTALDSISADGPRRMRLTVAADGKVEVALHPFTALPDTTLCHVGIAEARLSSGYPWLRHKTTQRQIYDTARPRLPEKAEELLFLNERDEVCEGTITNVFVDLGQGLLTPPVSCGLLPGILRERLLDEGRAREQVLHLSDLLEAQAIWVGNSLRGLIRAELVF